jgi:hypothetical protein
MRLDKTAERSQRTQKSRAQYHHRCRRRVSLMTRRRQALGEICSSRLSKIYQQPEGPTPFRPILLFLRSLRLFAAIFLFPGVSVDQTGAV